MTIDPYQTAQEAAAELRARSGVDSFDAALVMGSGWAPAADAFDKVVAEVAIGDLPGFLPPSVAGHSGRLRAVRHADRDILVFLGRTHLYEGRGVDPVVHNVRTAVTAGARTVVLTNAAGALRGDLAVGQPVLISDHLNLTARSPLTGPRFVDLTHAYAPELRALAREVEPGLAEGVYAALPGPHFETPAEIRMLRSLGADLVGMSTVLEAIAARELGARVLGLSLVTNVAAGLSDRPLDHHEVLEAGREAASDVGTLLAGIAARL
ncbi:purine-nucleoside phosphorylase [Marinitenerispora sediminis]|uniref:Purine nucleoside phosphorylase n=1 Tax=Marinitenerispora sediminis TaxID=1931232 RepID=A0A368SZW7_9ACTN|nr:purine-nucleoside phosphorylase [Marinitenerispora sediminis]RCV48069.1 purine-nucleoside phosphorylase [Marinitenerispora sediminis]RCV51426.1 purine-nucleoside phosphorylase [Marinitenerispora sediminis]RCV57697.1 purine-nucleoside phosphorylase [Marinitenerispora sediminis]